MGIPKNAKLLDINFIPHCSHMFPLTLNSNNPRHAQQTKNNVLAFFPANIHQKEPIPKIKNELSVSIQWIAKNGANRTPVPVQFGHPCRF